MYRILTLNTWKCEGDYDARLDAMTEALAALEPDLVCLQECFAVAAPAHADPAKEAARIAAGTSTAHTLARRLDLHCVHSPARLKLRHFRGGPVWSSSGLAILSREATGEAEVLTLPADPRDGERIAQALVVHAGGAPVRIVNLHLTHLRDDRALRARQLAAILAHWAHEDVPTVLAGDFNCTWADDALAALRALPHLDAGPEPPERWPPTLLAGPARAIDHLLLLDRTGCGLRITARRRVLDSRDAAGFLPSDHAGVLAELA